MGGGPGFTSWLLTRGRVPGEGELHLPALSHGRPFPADYIEVLDDDKAATTNIYFGRARAFFHTHGIVRIHRFVMDNGAIYPSKYITRCWEALAGRHQRIRPYAPRHNGKVERYNRLLADEVLYARPCVGEQASRDAIGVWVNHLKYRRPHTACGEQAPA